jgi:hypothetical protein
MNVSPAPVELPSVSDLVSLIGYCSGTYSTAVLLAGMKAGACSQCSLWRVRIQDPWSPHVQQRIELLEDGIRLLWNV